MPESLADTSHEKVVCPSCRRTLNGSPSRCPQCGNDLRGLGEANETLAGSGHYRAAAKRAEAAEARQGEVIDGRYKILEKLGEGGMGAVYKVEHVRMGKLVALKVLRPEAALARDAVKRFEQEAKIVSKLSHANTVSVFDFGTLPDGALFMAMEYVPGRDLARVLEAEGALSERRAVSVIIQVLRSLAEAHDAGIVHRDIKPANVMLLRTREGEDFVKVVDFGIAKLAEASRGADKTRNTGGAQDFVGTPLYMSPEQVSGEELDARSDLYSTGALLFELLTGRPPFDGPSPMAIAAKHLNKAAPRAREAAPERNISEAVDEIVDKALAKYPKARYANADAMRAALAATRDSIPLPALGAAEWDKARTGELAIARRDDFEAADRLERRMRWGKRLAPLIALLALGGSAAGAGYWLHFRPPAAPPARLPATAEVEPNEGPRTATLIAPGTDVSGHIQLPARDRADRDLFEISVPGTEPVRADVTLRGVENVNFALDLFAYSSDEGREVALARADDRFLRGGDERMTDLKLSPGRYLVRVADRRRPDEGPGSPRENRLDPYTLRVDLSPLHRFFEEEPNQRLDQAMRLSAARPVFGHAGARGEEVPGKAADGLAAADEFWSDDYYEVVLPKGATTACAVLSGVRGAALWLTVASTEGARAGADHLTKMLKEKPVRVAAGELGARCARAAESVIFKVSVAEGESPDRYVLAAVDDSDDGFAGALAACDELIEEGDAATCKGLLSKAVQALPVSRSVEAAKKRLAELP